MSQSSTLPEQLNLADHFLGRHLREGRGQHIALRLDDRNWTYAEVDGLADDYALVLRQRGVRREERVILALDDGPHFVGALFGILRHGAVGVMLNPQLGVKEIAAQLAYTRPRLAIVEASNEPSFRQASADSPWLESGLLIAPSRTADPADPSPSGFAAALREARQSHGDGPVPSAPTHRDDPALWLFSGGTTGRPKGVVQSHRSFANTTELYARRTLGWSADDMTLSVPKLFFGYATGSNLFFPFSVGGSAVLFDDKPTPEVIFEKIARHRPTILINVPTVIGRMLEHPAAGEQDLSCLRFATSAGEALSPDLHRRWRETFGVDLLDGLGTAEMWHIFLSNRPGEIRPGTLGRAVEGFDVEVRDSDGHPLADGEVGRLWVRGDSLALGYWQNHEKNKDAFRGEWFAAGDLVSRDADGFFTYCGRDDDAMKVAGRWLIPREVEDCLARHPRVDECAVIGVVDGAGLTKPHAFVRITPEANGEAGDEAGDRLADELKTWCLDHLEAYKHPRQVHLLSSFPRTHLGKIDRGALRRTVQDPPETGRGSGDGSAQSTASSPADITADNTAQSHREEK